MPDIATAPTATATQLRASGSRVLGFYMDGPARVDAPFNIAHFLTMNGAATQYLSTVLGSAAAPAYSFAGDPNTGINCSGSDALTIVTGGTTRLGIDSNGLHPATDNTFRSGWAGGRWSVVFAGTGTINTSDAREKTPMRALSSAELAAAKRISASIGAFQFLTGVRTHVGVMAQDVWAIMADEGLIDPITEGVTPDSKYAFLCYDEWDGDDAGNRFGIRPDQLALFLIAAQEARIAALEAAL